MSNPLDDAFAKAESARAMEDRIRSDKERAEELAVRDWLKAYEEILAAAPRRVNRSPQEITLAWSPEAEPPSFVRMTGVGSDSRGSRFAFGSCDVWRFTKDLGEKSRLEFFISTDCTSVFETEDFTSVKIKWSMGRRSLAYTLGSFIDVRTGRHDLRLELSPSSGDPPYHVYRSSLPRPTAIAEIIAEQELPHRR